RSANLAKFHAGVRAAHLKLRMRLRRVYFWTALLLVGAWCSGCALLAVPEPPPQTAPAPLEWRDDFLREHIRFFNGTESEGRGTASVGYARAATYVGARMRQF